MARWQLMGDWPHGSIAIPAGTTIDGTTGDDGKITATYNHMPLTLPMPIDAKAMDDEAAALMKQWYTPEHHYRLHYGPDVGKPQITGETAKPGKKKSA
jgi:hypothetical protein